MRVLITCLLLVSFSVIPLRAQETLDPRLASMRTIWLEAEDGIRDAPLVALCFAREARAALPLTVANERSLSDVVFRFRPVGNRVNLTVLLHDGQPLWSSPNVSLFSREAETGASAPCRAAQLLVEHSIDAMQAARSGHPYRPSGDIAWRPVPAAAHALPADQDKAFKILDVDYQITERNSVFWRFSWKMTVSNNGQQAILLDPSIEFLNHDGFIVDDGSEPRKLVAPQDVVEIRGYKLIRAEAAPSVATGVGKVRRSR